MGKAENAGGSLMVLALKTVFKAMLITAAALLILSLFVTYGNISDNAVNGCITAATVISVFMSGFFVSRGKARAGFMSGLIAGAIYVLLMLIVGFLVLGSMAVGPKTLEMFALSIVSGIIGGIFGVNFRKRRK